MKTAIMDLWRENRTANHYLMHMDDIAEKFAASKWAEIAKTAWPLERALRAFLTTDDEGLNSVFEEAQYPDLHEAVRKKVFPRS